MPPKSPPKDAPEDAPAAAASRPWGSRKIANASPKTTRKNCSTTWEVAVGAMFCNPWK